jgi:ABC-type sugar transport system substrate-binding protein
MQRCASTRRLLLYTGALTAASIVIAGCASSTSSTGQPPSTSNSAPVASSASCLAQARTLASDATKPMVPDVPSTPVDGAKLKGKSIWVITVFLAGNANAGEREAGYKAATAALGAKLTEFDGQGTVSTYNQGVTSAVNNHANAIILESIDPALVSGPLAAAKAAHIPVIDLLNGPPNAPLAYGLQGHVGDNFGNDAAGDVGLALSDAGCNPSKAGGLVLDLNESTIIVDADNGVTSTYHKLCPACSIATLDYTIQQIPQIGNLVVNAIRRNPSIHYVYAINDTNTPLIVSAFKQNGITGVKIISGVGYGPGLSLVASGQVFADYAEAPPAYGGWQAIDMLVRLANGIPQAAGEEIPVQLMTKSNLNLSDPFSLLGNYAALFEKDWGVG